MVLIGGSGIWELPQFWHSEPTFLGDMTDAIRTESTERVSTDLGPTWGNRSCREGWVRILPHVEDDSHMIEMTPPKDLSWRPLRFFFDMINYGRNAIVWFSSLTDAAVIPDLRCRGRDGGKKNENEKAASIYLYHTHDPRLTMVQGEKESFGTTNLRWQCLRTRSPRYFQMVLVSPNKIKSWI